VKAISLSYGGLGNRLKSLWSTRMVFGSDAKLIWPQQVIRGRNEQKSGRIEEYSELFVDDSVGKQSEQDSGMYTWRLWWGQQIVDGMYQNTPKAVIDAYQPIVRLTLESVRPELRFRANEFGKYGLGIHARSLINGGEHIDWRKVISECGKPCFVSCDTLELRDFCRSIDGVHVLEKLDPSRDLLDQWAFALVEMLILGSCTSLIGVQWSTFMECAWWLGGCVGCAKTLI
jgi:hypothetical protein